MFSEQNVFNHECLVAFIRVCLPWYPRHSKFGRFLGMFFASVVGVAMGGELSFWFYLECSIVRQDAV